MKTILAAVDFSDISKSVVAVASELARSTKGRVVLLTVVEPPVIVSENALMIENIAEISAASEKTAASHLARIQKQLRAGRIDNRAIRLNGAPGPHILAQAKKNGADYIVMGSHGHTAFYDLLVGSTTHSVLHRAPCPVVIVPPGKSRGRRKK